MIANYTKDGWQIITQRSHGLLAAQIAAHWRLKDRTERWMETLLAIAEHDDAENELDGEDLLTSTGGPLNFTMKQFDLYHCQRLFSMAFTKSRFIALLTSMHMQFVYRPFADENSEAKAFLDEQQRLQSVWRKELGLSKEELEKTYNLMEWCDALSLLLCKGELQPEQRRLEISTGPDKSMYYLSQLDTQRLTVEPWPFDVTSFEVYFESRMLSQL